MKLHCLNNFLRISGGRLSADVDNTSSPTLQYYGRKGAQVEAVRSYRTWNVKIAASTDDRKVQWCS